MSFHMLLKTAKSKMGMAPEDQSQNINNKAVIMRKQKIIYWLLRIRVPHITFILRKK